MATVNLFGELALDSTLQSVISTAVPDENHPAVVVTGQGAQTDRISFAKTISNGIDTSWGSIRKRGSGMTVNQTGGNLVITTGTTANSETIIRGGESFTGGIRFRHKTTLSQRIVNQSFFVEMVDVIADGAAITINSATLVTVTVPAHGFTAEHVGWSMRLGGYTGTGTFIPGLYAIASVPDTNTLTFTVSGFAAGSGTVDLFGLNFYQVLFDGTSATSMKYDTGRNGRSSGHSALTCETTASGNLITIIGNDQQSAIMEGAVGVSSGRRFTTRGHRVENVPDDKALRVQIRAVNSSSAPASSTTWTIGLVGVGNFQPLDTVLQDVRPIGASAPLPVQLADTPNVAISGWSLNGGTGYHVIGGASLNAAAVKTTGGVVHELTCFNPTASTLYLKLYNKSSAPAPATDTGSGVLVATIPVAAGAFVSYNFGTLGKRLASGIGVATTLNPAANDATVLGTAGVQISLTYV